MAMVSDPAMIRTMRKAQKAVASGLLPDWSKRLATRDNSDDVLRGIRDSSGGDDASWEKLEDAR